MKFEHLINNIEVVHNELHQQAIQQVNNALTIRNSLIGFYIVSYEQKGDLADSVCQIQRQGYSLN
jgi:hypothetical protein